MWTKQSGPDLNHRQIITLLHWCVIELEWVCLCVSTLMTMKSTPPNISSSAALFSIHRSLPSPSPCSGCVYPQPPLLLGKTNLGQSLLLNEFYSDRLLPFQLQRQLQRTQPSPQPGTPPHSESDWLRHVRLQHLSSPIGSKCSVIPRLARM